MMFELQVVWALQEGKEIGVKFCTMIFVDLGFLTKITPCF